MAYVKPDFTDTENAFKGLSNKDLKIQRLLFEVLKSPSMVKMGKWGLSVAQKLSIPLAWAVKPTIYAHFVGGETLGDCLPTLQHLKSRGVYAVPDFSAEMGNSERENLETYNENLAAIEFAAEHRDTVSHAVFKAGGLANVETLIKYIEQPDKLSGDEVKEVEQFHERFLSLCGTAYQLDVKVLIDAEHYAYQGLIDKYTEEAMQLYNREKAIVFATLQMYRKDRLDYLKKMGALAQQHNIFIGVKIVRGAYMEEERARARSMGYEDPINPDKATTDSHYNDALRYILQHIDRFELFCGTHNAESLLLLTELMQQYHLEVNDPRIFFAQLYGMSDNLTYALSKCGYNVAKYLPYAPVNKVLPYLIRRAEENTAVRGQTSRELQLIHTELQRRAREKH